MQNTEQNTSARPMLLLPLRGLAIFPGMVSHFDVGRQKSIKTLELAMSRREPVFLLAQRDMKVDDPQREDLYDIGTVGHIKQILKIHGDVFRVLVEGECRGKLLELTSTEPVFSAMVEPIQPEEPAHLTKRDEAMIRNVQELFVDYTDLVPKVNSDVVLNVMESRDMGYLCDYVAQNTALKYPDKQEVLEQLNPRRRMALLIKKLASEVDILRIEDEIQNKVRSQMDQNQRDYYLREQIKVINEELGEDEDTAAEAQRYTERILALGLEERSEKKMLKEAARLQKLQPFSPEAGVVRTWLDTCLDLPWKTVTKENTSLKKAETILNNQHYGLEKVKERILELFAVKQKVGSIKGQILCLVGPPGVGKTSVARSVADALGRNYARLSLGGVRDEADIRGHRKTYIGAMPGRIINALQQAGSRNALILVDEIDKMASDFRGDPASALLEVFDTEQNHAFRDHFVELPFDLTDILFITTANTLDTIPRPLLDRMEIIELPGYTVEEKVQIAKRHLIPKQMEKHGLNGKELKISENALRKIISGYTREAGVRTLERQIARVCRKTDKILLEKKQKSVSVTPANLGDFLGVIRYKEEVHSQRSECGVVNGLAWTSVGGEILEVEVNVMEGSGKLELTGNLGDVMKESAKAAISYIRTRTKTLGIQDDFYKKKDIHIHFPEGAVPKDGPSAGITTCTALVSALMDVPMPQDIAMTGEVTIRGRVLPIGGLKEKTMAAYRAHMKTVIVPADNEPDISEIDPVVAKNLRFVYAKHMDDVLEAALGVRTGPEESPQVLPHPTKESESLPLRQ
ncbi:endopeptidase La [Intestinimonas sp. MSJ-38]|uniref:endopeptidase La n=1 Tax=Intestinimonas sp. MSJ-38 TaxID=2841532 RepID=UPI001C1060F9|nr:endopeptidase La [Intestinimonas sp. MSJ-38]MBU5433136.1 endopeptidase La [Intestinimonas sp. MSJ-38]